MNQRILRLAVSEPLDIADHSDPPVMAKSIILEFDLVKDTVRLPGGFVCRLVSLARVLDEALAAQKRLDQEEERAFHKKMLGEEYHK